MNTVVTSKRDQLNALCQRFHVRKLELFGSAVEGDFDEAASDLDFLVEFRDLKTGEHADSYFGLLEALETLFDRRIDLVMTRAVTNQFFLQRIADSRTTLYAA